ncbi:MAG: DUF3795 domain-containing protein [bacterium]|jgi:hypothetical protein
MEIKYPEIGICGLACHLCPRYHTDGSSRCGGCKSEYRMGGGCLFITCAVKKKGIEFCWECGESLNCEKWRRHREDGKKADSFKCYQKLEDDIEYVQKNRTLEFKRRQNRREAILKEMLKNYNEGRSKSYYCVAATVMEVNELQEALAKAEKNSQCLDLKGKAKFLHSRLDEIAARQGYCLRLRK